MGESARTPGAASWPGQMITQAEAFTLAAGWPLYVANALAGPPDRLITETHLRCGKCQGSCGQLDRGGTPYNGSLDEMLSMVLRHMVMAHNVSLAGLRKPVGDLNSYQTTGTTKIERRDGI